MPILTVIAGPNGSGKSSLTRSVEFDGSNRLLDPDAVARHLNPADPAAARISAARAVLQLTEEYLAQRVSFALETTLSSPGRLAVMRRAKEFGYEVRLIFVALDHPARCMRRIRNRVARGGHFVPDEDVTRGMGGASPMRARRSDSQTSLISTTIRARGIGWYSWRNAEW